MSDEISVRNVKKFDGTNFQMWKFLMNTVFVAYGVKDVVDGKSSRPSESDARKAWDKDNARAMYIISSSIEDKHLECLLTCTTAHEMWTKMAMIHEQKSESSKLILIQKFYKYKMDVNDSVVQHFAKVQNMARQLEDVGEKMSDVAIMAKILASLPSKYNPLITAWDSVEAESQTISNLQLRLLKEETRLTAEEETASALAAMNISEKSKIQQKTKGDKQEQRTKSNVKSRMDLKCHYCKKTGHFARECRKKKRDEESDDAGKTAFVVTTFGKNNYGGEAASFNADEKELLCRDINDVWLADSCASRHATSHREWFDSFTSITGESVLFAEGNICEATGVGTIQIEMLMNGRWHEAQLENVLYIPQVRRNLFSVGECATRGYCLSFKDRSVTISRGGAVKAVGVLQENKIYRMFFRVRKPSTVQDANVTATLRTWHERLEHVNAKTPKDTTSKKLIKGIEMTAKFFSESCKIGKAHFLRFTERSEHRNTKPGEYIHSDVCGPVSIDFLGGSRCIRRPHFWRDGETLKVPVSLFRDNRERLVSRLKANPKEIRWTPDTFIVLQGGVDVPFNDTDINWPFRQESFFQWCFGVEEPDCYGAIDVSTGASILFVPRLPPEYAIWEGKLYTLDDFKERYGVDETHYTDEIASVLKGKSSKLLLALNGTNSDSGLKTRELTFDGIGEFRVDHKHLYPAICECRVIKSPQEIEVLRYVCKISSEAHKTVMRSIRPGIPEYKAEARFLHYVYAVGGCRHVSYTCICGSGHNSSILHYGHSGAPNSKVVQDGDMCLFDMGGNYCGYAADITCSYPANGKFTEDQKLIYNAVLKARDAVIAAAKPGVAWTDMHLLANRVMLTALKEGGLLVGDVEEMIKAGLNEVFQPHGLGHLLGLDVHDVGGYLPGHPERSKDAGVRKLRTARTLLAGMVLTVEPGCYFIDCLLDAALVDPIQSKFLVQEQLKRFRGFGGVRIEDDVLITETGVENMTDVPRTVEEIENFMRSWLIKEDLRFRRFEG